MDADSGRGGDGAQTPRTHLADGMERKFHAKVESNYKGGFMKKWDIKDNDPRVPYLNATGFGWVRKLMPFQVDNALLRCLLTRYQTDTHTFKLGPSGKWMITVEDMICFTGMTVGRKQIQLNRTEGWEKLCKDNLGVEPEKKHMNREAISFKWLIDNFERIGNRGRDEEAEDLKISVRAYLLYVIGSVIFPTSDSHVSTQYLHYLGDLDNVKVYSWLLAMLSCVLTNFAGKVSDSGTKYLEGCAPIIMLWAYEHYHELAPPHVTDDFSEDREIPLMVYWSEKLEKKRAGSMTVEKFEKMVDNLEYTPINVQYPADLPDLKKDLVLSMIEGPLFHGVNKYVYNPHLCPEQFNLTPCSSSAPKVPSIFKLRDYYRTGPIHDWVDTPVKNFSFVSDYWIIDEIVNISVGVEDRNRTTSSHSPIKRMKLDDRNAPIQEDDNEDDNDSSTRNQEDASIDDRCSFWYPAGRCTIDKESGSLYCGRHQNPESRKFGRPKSRKFGRAK